MLKTILFRRQRQKIKLLKTILFYGKIRKFAFLKTIIQYLLRKNQFLKTIVSQLAESGISVVKNNCQTENSVVENNLFFSEVVKNNSSVGSAFEVVKNNTEIS